MQNSYVLVTGASSGIGRQCAVQLSQNYDLILCARRKEKLIETKNMCKNPNNHLIFSCDLSDIDNLESSLIEFIKSNNITIEKFLHSAGTIGMMPLKLVTADFILNCLKINLISAHSITRILASKKYNDKALNNVVYISSNIAKGGGKCFSVYSASKSGLNGMMRSLAMELAPRVRVNCVLPGAILTEMTENINKNEELAKRMADTYPLGFGQTKYIADTVEFLFSDKSCWITGQEIVVDGGRSVNMTG